MRNRPRPAPRPAMPSVDRGADRRTRTPPGRSGSSPDRSVRRWLLAPILVAAFWPALPAPAQTAEEVEAELDQLTEEIQAISRRLERERARRDDEQAALARVERELSRIALDLRGTRARLARARARKLELATRAQTLEAAVEERRARVAEQLRIAYRTGLRSRLKSLLNQEDPAEISRVLALHGYLGRARLDAISSLEDELRQLQSVRAEQREVARELQALAERQAESKARQDKALAERQGALAALDASIRDQAARLTEMRESAEDLEALLGELANALADIPPDTEIEDFANLKGELAMPVDAPVRAAFADRRNGDVTWQGWLIETELGEPVRAVAYGRVAYADWLRGYGMMLIIEHGDGYMTLYGQNQSLVAEVGDWVGPGDVIALAGNTGGNSAPGLYFQIRREGRPVDPAGWIDR